MRADLAGDPEAIAVLERAGRQARDAGALATALSILKPAESARLVASIPGAEYLLVKKNGEKIMSSGWKSLEALPYSKASATRRGSSPDGRAGG